MYQSDTIAAIATPPGCGGIGIVRVSGPGSEQIARRIFRGSPGGDFESHRLYYGRLVHPLSGFLIDEGMAVLMRAPRSYTREDVVELHCHGGYLVVCSLLQACVAAGARLADPGEFTRRAFLNGRIDLCQAESVIDIINSRTEASLALAQRQREGHLGRELEEVRRLLTEALAVIEAHIDFPEDDLGESSLTLVNQCVSDARHRVSRLIDSYRYGKVFRDGVSVLLAGKPNVGKSSLLNALACEERAIVSSIPGTTRDIIEEIVTIDGLPVRVIDAAGIRHDHDDEIEREGIRRTLAKLDEADLVLFLADGSRPLDEDDRQILDALSDKPYVTIITKSDLPRKLDVSLLPSPYGSVSISVASGVGLGELRTRLFDFFVQDAPRRVDELVAISSARHRDILERSLNSLDLFATHVAESLDPSLLSIDLRDALSAVGEITGATTPDSILDSIFSTFCIGK